MKCQVKRTKEGRISTVEDFNGVPSKKFNELAALLGDKEVAASLVSVMYNPEVIKDTFSSNPLAYDIFKVLDTKNESINDFKKGAESLQRLLAGVHTGKDLEVLGLEDLDVILSNYFSNKESNTITDLLYIKSKAEPSSLFSTALDSLVRVKGITKELKVKPEVLNSLDSLVNYENNFKTDELLKIHNDVQERKKLNTTSGSILNSLEGQRTIKLGFPSNMALDVASRKHSKKVSVPEKEAITIEKARYIVNKIAGKNIQVATAFTQVLENAKATGLPAGMFYNGVIYLNENNLTANTVYHEAFHAVFRMALTPQQREVLIEEARKDNNFTKEEMDSLIEGLKEDYAGSNFDLNSLSRKELEALVYEEILAEAFEDYQTNSQIPANGILGALMSLLNNIIKFVLNNKSQTETIFAKINKGGFKIDSVVNDESTLKTKVPMFKTIKIGDTVDNQGFKKEVFADETETNSIISIIASKIHDSIYNLENKEIPEDEKFTNIESFVKNYIEKENKKALEEGTDISDYDLLAARKKELEQETKEIGKQAREETDAVKKKQLKLLFQKKTQETVEVTKKLKKLKKDAGFSTSTQKSKLIPNLSIKHNDGNTNSKVITEGVYSRFKAVGVNLTKEDIEKEAEENMTAETKEAQDLSDVEYDPMSVMDRQLRAFLSFTNYEIPDPNRPGKTLEVAVDGSAVFYGLLRFMHSNDLDSVEDMLKMIERYSTINSQTKAVYNRLLKIYQNDPEDVILKLLRKNLNLEKITAKAALVDTVAGNVQITEAAKETEVHAQIKQWENNWYAFGLDQVYNLEKNENFEEALDQLREIKNLFDRIENSNSLEKNQLLYNEIDSLVDDLFNGTDSRRSFLELTGIDVSKGFIKASLIRVFAKAKVNVSKDDLDFYNHLNSKIVIHEDYADKKELTLFLSSASLTKMMQEFKTTYLNFDNHSPYVIKYDTDAIPSSKASALLNTSGESKMEFNMAYHVREMARANALIDERVVNTTYKNAANKTIFGFAKKSYQLVMARWLKEPAYREEMIKKYPALKKLTYASDPEIFAEIMEGMEMFKTGDLRQTNVDEYDAYGTRIGSRSKDMDRASDKEGVTSKNTTLAMLNVNNLAHFAYNRKKVGDWYYSTYYTKTYESKNNDIAVMLPVGTKGNPSSMFNKDGNISSTAVNEIYKILETEIEFLNEEEQKMIEHLEELKQFINEDNHGEINNVKEEIEQLQSKVNDILFNSIKRSEAKNFLLEQGFLEEEISPDQITEAIYQVETINNPENSILLKAEKAIKQKQKEIKDKVKNAAKANNFKFINKYHIKVGKNGKISLGRIYELWQMAPALGNNEIVTNYLKNRKRRMELILKRDVNEEELSTDEQKELRNLNALVKQHKEKGFTKTEQTSIKRDIKDHMNSEKEKYVDMLIDLGLFEINDADQRLIPTFAFKLPSSKKIDEKEEAVEEELGTKKNDKKGKSKKEQKASTERASDMYQNYEQFIGDFFFNHFIAVSNFNTIVDKDHRMRKNPTDAVKRNGGSVAFGDSLGKGTFTVAYLADPIAKSKYGTDTEIADGQSYMTFSRLQFMNNTLGRVNEDIEKIYEKLELGQEITWGEKVKLEKAKAALTSVKGVYFDGESYNKLSYTVLSKNNTSFLPTANKKKASFLATDIKKINEKIRRAKKNHAGAAVIKDLREAKKLLLDKYDSLWQALPGKEKLHNLRVAMELGGIDEVLPESASKLKTVIAKGTEGDDFDFSYSVTTLENRHWKLQVETPSGKTKITYFSQVMHLIDNEQQWETKVSFRGKDTTIGEVINEYRNTLADRVHYSIEEAFKKMGRTNGEGQLIEVDKDKLTMMLYDNLKASASSDTVLNFLRDSTYNLNLPSLREKFEQMFLTHFKNYLQPKVPGRKVYLISDYGNKLIINTNTGEIVRQADFLKNPEYYVDASGKLKDGFMTRDLEWSQGYSTDFNIILNDGNKGQFSYNKNKDYKFATFFAEDIAKTNTYKKLTGGQEFNLATFFNMAGDNHIEIIHELLADPNVDSDKLMTIIFGRAVKAGENELSTSDLQSYAEVIMPHFDPVLAKRYKNKTFVPGTDEYNEVMTMLGARIPTQDKHSMIAFRIVDFMPLEYGDVGVFPKEIVELSGADFDIDSLYMIRKDFYTLGDVVKAFGSADTGKVTENEMIFAINDLLVQGFAKLPVEEQNELMEKMLGKTSGTRKENLKNLYNYYEYRIYMAEHNKDVKRSLNNAKANDTAYNEIQQDIELERKSIQIVSSDADKKVEKAAELAGLSLLEDFRHIKIGTFSNYRLKGITEEIKNKFGTSEAHMFKLFLSKMSYASEKYSEAFELLNDVRQVLLARRNKDNATMTEAEAIKFLQEKYPEITLENVNVILGNDEKAATDLLFKLLYENRNEKDLEYNKHELVWARRGIIFIASTLSKGYEETIKNKKLDLAFTSVVTEEDKENALYLERAIKEARKDRDDYIKEARKRIEEKKENLKFREQQLLTEVIEDYESPSTAEEHTALSSSTARYGNGPNLKSIHNKIFDTNILFYLNGAIKKITDTSASMTVLHGDGSNTKAGLSNIMTFLDGSEAAQHDYNSILGQMTAKNNNRVGLSLVGPSAVSNIVKATLARVLLSSDSTTSMGMGSSEFNLALYEANDIEFYADYDENGNIKEVTISIEEDEDGVKKIKKKKVRIMDEISSILSAMTDNAKHTDAAKLSFDLDNLGAFLFLLSGGVGASNIALLAKQPIMEEVKDRNDKKKQGIDVSILYSASFTKLLQNLELSETAHKLKITPTGSRSYVAFKNAALKDAGVTSNLNISDLAEGVLNKYGVKSATLEINYLSEEQQKKLDSKKKELAEKKKELKESTQEGAVPKVVAYKKFILDKAKGFNKKELFDFIQAQGFEVKLDSKGKITFFEKGSKNPKSSLVYHTWYRNKGGASVQDTIETILASQMFKDADKVKAKKFIEQTILDFLTQSKKDNKEALSKERVNKTDESTQEEKTAEINKLEQEILKLEKEKLKPSKKQKDEAALKNTLFKNNLSFSALMANTRGDFENKVKALIEEAIEGKDIDETVMESALEALINSLSEHEILEKNNKQGVQLLKDLLKSITENKGTDAVVAINTKIGDFLIDQIKKGDLLNKLAKEIEKADTLDVFSEPNSENASFPIEMMYAIKVRRRLKDKYKITKFNAEAISALMASGQLDRNDIEKLKGLLVFQVYIKDFYKKARHGSDKMRKVGSLIRLHQGLGAEFKKIDSIRSDLEDLGVLETRNNEVKADNSSKKEDEFFDAAAILERSADLQELVKAFKNIEDAASRIVLSRHPLIMAIRAKLENELGEAVTYNKNSAFIERAIIKFINYNLMKHAYSISGKVLPYDSSIIYSSTDNIVSKFETTLKKAKEKGVDLQDNLFIKLLRKQNRKEQKLYFEDDGGKSVSFRQNLLTINSRTKQSPEFQNRVTDAFRDLMHDTTTDEDGNFFVQEFMQDLMGYALIKDGLVFGSGSFLQLAAPEVFSDLSAMYNKLMTSDIDTAAKMLGTGTNEVIDTFVELLISDPDFQKLSIGSNISKKLRNKDIENTDAADILSLTNNTADVDKFFNKLFATLENNKNKEKEKKTISSFTLDIGKQSIYASSSTALIDSGDRMRIATEQNNVIQKIKKQIEDGSFENISNREAALFFINYSNNTIRNIDTAIADIESREGVSSFMVEILKEELESFMEKDILFAELEKIKEENTNLTDLKSIKRYSYKEMKEEMSEKVEKYNENVFDGRPVVSFKIRKIGIGKEAYFEGQFVFPKIVKFTISKPYKSKKGSVFNKKHEVTFIRTTEGLNGNGTARYKPLENAVSIGFNYTTERSQLPTVIKTMVADYKKSKQPEQEFQKRKVEEDSKKAKEKYPKKYDKRAQGYDNKIISNLTDIMNNYSSLFKKADSLIYNYKERMTDSIEETTNAQLSFVRQFIPGIEIQAVEGKESLQEDPNWTMEKIEELENNPIAENDFMFYTAAVDSSLQYNDNIELISTSNGKMYKKQTTKVNSLRDLMEIVRLKTNGAVSFDQIPKKMFSQKTSNDNIVLENVIKRNNLSKSFTVTFLTPVQQETQELNQRFTNKVVVAAGKSESNTAVRYFTRGVKTDFKFVVNKQIEDTSDIDTVSKQNISKLMKLSNVNTVIVFGDYDKKAALEKEGITVIDGNNLNNKNLVETLNGITNPQSIGFVFGDNVNFQNAASIVEQFNFLTAIKPGEYKTTRAFINMVNKDPKVNATVSDFLKTGMVMGPVTATPEIIEFLTLNQKKLNNERLHYIQINANKAFNKRVKNNAVSTLNNAKTSMHLGGDNASSALSNALGQMKKGVSIVVEDGKTSFFSSNVGKQLAIKIKQNSQLSKAVREERMIRLDITKDFDTNLKTVKDAITRNPNVPVLFLNSLSYGDENAKNKDNENLNYLKRIFEKIAGVEMNKEEELYERLRDNNIIC